MPHFFIMGQEETTTASQLLERSQLHISAANSLFDHNKLFHGIVTYFDALESAIRWYLMEREISSVLAMDFTELLDKLNNELPSSMLNDICEFGKFMDDVLDDDNVGLPSVMTWKEKLDRIFSEIDVTPFELEVSPEDDAETRKVLGFD